LAGGATHGARRPRIATQLDQLGPELVGWLLSDRVDMDMPLQQGRCLDMGAVSQTCREIHTAFNTIETVKPVPA
jgi:hypothetical protein